MSTRKSSKKWTLLLVGAGSILIVVLFSCIGCCGISLLFGPTEEGEMTQPTRVFASATAIPTAIAQLTGTPLPIDTLEPTNPALLPTAIPLRDDMIVDSSAILNASVQEVEELLGSPTEILAMGIGAAEEIPDGGESRTYQVGQYTIYVNYDKAGIARGLQVVDGLLEDGYSLDEWPIVLERIGVEFAGWPDVEAPGARRWSNASGYAIMMAANKVGGDIWTVRIYKIPE